jgi:hypothetical protein
MLWFIAHIANPKPPGDHSPAAVFSVATLKAFAGRFFAANFSPNPLTAVERAGADQSRLAPVVMVDSATLFAGVSR